MYKFLTDRVNCKLDYIFVVIIDLVILFWKSLEDGLYFVIPIMSYYF